MFSCFKVEGKLSLIEAQYESSEERREIAERFVLYKNLLIIYLFHLMTCEDLCFCKFIMNL